MIQTEFEFSLPKGYIDTEGNLHRTGVMRLARAIDEIVPMRDPRVKTNPAYATAIILSRVITRLGALDNISPATIEGLFVADLNYLQKFYRKINELEEEEEEEEPQKLAENQENED
ncbi:phage tail assembly protein [Spirulina sp. 06S082]|uniref:phage tail assembly protein n=1 Tax=Spirulina sp. 06S082 TaxID=3110248 RepID=UPI002B206191|nr:phage tail assembly protein [Spirulina sp. 06S082]MEA5467387.1 phage tail assembly protein [Spirulina sp. 06S082]